MLAIACVLVLLAAVAGTPVAGGVTDDDVDLDGALEETVDENLTDVDDGEVEETSEEAGNDVPDDEVTTNETSESEDAPEDDEQDGNLVEQTIDEVDETVDETVPDEGTENDTEREEGANDTDGETEEADVEDESEPAENDSDEANEDTEEAEVQDGEADDVPDEEDTPVLKVSETDDLLNDTTDTVAEGDPVEETLDETEEALEPNDDSDEEDEGLLEVSETDERLNETTDTVAEGDPVEDTINETEEALEPNEDSDDEDDELLEVVETDELLNETTESVEEIEPIEETINETEELTDPVEETVDESATVAEVEESLEEPTNDSSLADLTEDVTDTDDGLTGAVESDVADTTNATTDGLVKETIVESDDTDLLEEDRATDLIENATREPLEDTLGIEDESPLRPLLENESDEALLDAAILDDDGVSVVENETTLGSLVDGERDALLAIDGVEVAGVEANLSTEGDLSGVSDDLVQSESIYGLLSDGELLADEERPLDLELVVLGEDVEEDVVAALLEEDLVVVTGPDGELVLLDRGLESDALLEDELLRTLLEEPDRQLETLLGEEGLSGSLESGLAVLDLDDGGLQVVPLLVDETVSTVVETTDIADVEELVTAADEDRATASTTDAVGPESQTTGSDVVRSNSGREVGPAASNAGVPTERSERIAAASLAGTSDQVPTESQPDDDGTSPFGAVPAPIRLRDAAVLGAVGAGSAVLGTAILAGQGASATGSIAPALSSRLRIPRIPFFPGYQRHDETDPLENEVRAAMYEAIESRPGIHVSALADDLDVSRSTVRYHQRILEYENLITSEKIRGRRRIFPVGRDDLAMATVQAEDTRADVLHLIANREPVSISRLADALECDVSTISYHVGRLEEDALIEREADGARVHVTLAPRSRAVLEPSNDEAVAQLD